MLPIFSGTGFSLSGLVDANTPWDRKLKSFLVRMLVIRAIPSANKSCRDSITYAPSVMSLVFMAPALQPAIPFVAISAAPCRVS
jgi:hypothetical protein